jgi:hypothetical protein
MMNFVLLLLFLLLLLLILFALRDRGVAGADLVPFEISVDGFVVCVVFHWDGKTMILVYRVCD